jgi:flavin-binding protein dodecin
MLKSSLIDFKRDALRYDANDNVEEYRIKLIVNLELSNAKTGAVMWKEKGFSGETTYRTSGSLAKSDDAAVNDAIDDLSRRIVERTVEAW